MELALLICTHAPWYIHRYKHRLHAEKPLICAAERPGLLCHSVTQISSHHLRWNWFSSHFSLGLSLPVTFQVGPGSQFPWKWQLWGVDYGIISLLSFFSSQILSAQDSTLKSLEFLNPELATLLRTDTPWDKWNKINTCFWSMRSGSR